ncbi:MAG TPA: ornithine cyclodeaminase family protein [Candidatus Dormibacteraeota bacterium]|nr:ornithine cyclodeaminase family protein [Candidatus Dormibacteraeota bacterium]
MRPSGAEFDEILLLDQGEVEATLAEASLLDVMRVALTRYTEGVASAPPRVAVASQMGWLAAMPGYIPDLALATKLISVFPENAALGRPSHQGIVALFDEVDGRLLCLMDARSITARRTAAVSVLSITALARPGWSVVALLGSGTQAVAHLDALKELAEPSEIRISARRSASARELAARDPRCRSVSTFREAVTDAEVVICCTDSEAPVVERGWLKSGCHVVSVGSGQELDGATVNDSSVFVEWRGAATNRPPAGARELQDLAPAGLTELGEVLIDPRRGRRNGEEITVFKSTGLAVEDAAAARLVYEAALSRGTGRKLPW